MHDLTYLSATSLVAHFEDRSLSPVEVTEALLIKLAQSGDPVNAFGFVDAQGSVATARASELRWSKGEPLGALDGVPCTIKELFRVEGWPLRSGSLATDDTHRSADDSPVTARLRESGAVLIGKTTMPEFAWKATGDSPLTGSTLNPWSLGHTSGGSSAGAAASLAAGLGTLAVGSDGGGSIRIPASFCGVVGFKPSQGLVPYFPRGAMGTLSHCGPMARDVQDLALMLSVIGRPDHRDPYHNPPSAIDFLDGLKFGVKGLRIAYSPTLGYLGVHDEVRAALDVSANVFASLGAVVEQVDPGFESPLMHFNTMWKTGAAHILSVVAPERRAIVETGLFQAAAEGMDFSAMDVVMADLFRTRLSEHMGLFHQKFDLLLTPTVAVPALPKGEILSNVDTEREWLDWAGFSYPFNMTRQPAISVPCGFTRDGRPIGLQLVGALHADAMVLRAAQAFESAMPSVTWPLLAAATRSFPAGL